MALLKAFVCQVVLLGLYKLFLEQVVEEYLVPEELTRNCLVGFVCLLCFGIQLYTDKPDEENAETDENPKANSEASRATGTTKSESAAKSGNRETSGSHSSSQVTASKTQTTSREIAKDVKMFPNDHQVADSRERSNANEVERFAEGDYSGVFAKFSSNMSGSIQNIDKAEGIREPEVSASQTSYGHESTSIPVLNGFSETNVCEESDEDGIEIDHFVAEESPTEKSKQLETTGGEEEKTIKTEVVAEKSEQLRTDEIEAIVHEDVTEEATQLRTVEENKSEGVTKAVVESECLVDGENISSTRYSDEATSSKIGESSDAEMTNGTTEESFNDIDSISSKIIEETDSKNSVRNGNGQEICPLSSEPDDTKDNAESLLSAQQISNTNSTSKKVSTVDTMNKNNAETSTPERTRVTSPSEKLMVSSRQKLATAGDLCIPPNLIDISFIYACHRRF